MKRDLWAPNLMMPDHMAPLCGPFLFSGPPNWGDCSSWPLSSKNSKILQIQFWHFFLKIWVFGIKVHVAVNFSQKYYSPFRVTSYLYSIKMADKNEPMVDVK